MLEVTKSHTGKETGLLPALRRVPLLNFPRMNFWLLPLYSPGDANISNIYHRSPTYTVPQLLASVSFLKYVSEIHVLMLSIKGVIVT